MRTCLHICVFAALYMTRNSIQNSIAIIQEQIDAITPAVYSYSNVSIEAPTTSSSLKELLIIEDANDTARSDAITLQSNKEPTTEAVNIQSSSLSKENVTDDEEDMTARAIVAISLGEGAAASKMVERFVWSARNKGEYNGWIVLLTDAPEERYEGISKWTDHFITIHPTKELFSTNHKYTQMARKRYKTFVIEQINTEPRLDGVKLLYYLDVDIVFGNPLAPLFDGLENKYEIGRGDKNETGPARMWMFKGNNKHWKVQGGQMILDRTMSQPCLDRWRWHMDDDLDEIMDQELLNKMVKEQEDKKKSTKCEIVIMKQEKRYIEFPDPIDIVRVAKAYKEKKNSRRTYAPLVHIRNTGGVKRTSKWNYQKFIRDILGMKEKDDTLGITKKQNLG